MKKRSTIILLLTFFLSTAAIAQRSGIITGTLMDGSNNEPMAFANIYVEGTTIGTVSDVRGHFRLVSVPAGSQVLVYSFLGFAEQKITVNVVAGESVEMETVTMTPETIMGEEVVVTALMRGQVAAINQQVNSNTIVNIVSKDKIEEIPDVNAAEAVSRLPGITINRNAGEGSQVTVRGVSPKFNSITLNGLRIPATGSGSRSVDLSMISSDILQGIEVYKALTPDMDADAVGGSVNLVTKTADAGLTTRVQLESGYHGLIKNIGTYKGSVTLGNRFLDGKIGLLGTFTGHRANRNSDEFDASYELQDVDIEGNPIPITSHVFLINKLETRDRYSASATADYKMKNGGIVFDYFFTRTDRDITSRDIDFFPDRSSVEYGIGRNFRELSLNSYQLRGNHDLKRLIINYSLSLSRVKNENPVSYGSGAGEEAAYTDYDVYARPQEVPTYADFNLSSTTGGSGFGWSNSTIRDQNMTGQLDLKVPLFATNWLNGYIKTGAKIRQKVRDREINSYSIDDGAEYFYAFLAEYPDLKRQDRVFYFENFIDPAFTGYQFPMGTTYTMPYIYDERILTEHYNKFQPVDSLWYKNLGTKVNEYDAVERIAAGYIMAEINIAGLMILPGVRYEQDYNEYTGTVGFRRGTERAFNLTDTTGNRTIGTWLPMLHLRYKFMDNLSLRLAATKTLTRPDFLNLAPFEFINYGSQHRTVNRGSLDLLIPTAWNYDAIVNWNSKFGFFSVGAFYKKIENVDIDIKYKDLSGTAESNPTFGYQLTNPINSEDPTIVYGMEFDIQTNFRWLPKPFDGLILNMNYAFVKSETYYPFFWVDYPPPDYRPVIADSSRINRLPGQANDIINLTVGYEKKGFSARFSMNFQGNKLTSSGASAYLDTYSADYLRWDAVISQKFAKKWMVILNLINIANTPEKAYMYIPENPTQEEYYGWAANLAIRFEL